MMMFDYVLMMMVVYVLMMMFDYVLMMMLFMIDEDNNMILNE
jgi:hypothetical protein